MYSISDLLELAQSERAEKLRIRVGAAPTFVLRGEHHTVEGCKLTEEDAEQLLRSLANTRQMRELWERGRVQFIYKLRDYIPFLVYADKRDESIRIEIT